MALTRVGGAVKSDRIFDTVADMVASKTVKVGDIVETAGYTTVNDGGHGKYEIVAAGTSTDDGGSFIDLDTHQAKAIFGDYIDVRKFGAKCDGVTDDSAACQAAHDYGISVVYPTGDVLFSSTVNITKAGQKVTGGGWNNTSTGASTRILTTTDINTFKVTGDYVFIQNIFFENTGATMSVAHIWFAGDSFPSMDRCRLQAASNTTALGGGLLLDDGAGGIGGSAGSFTNINVSHGTITIKRADVHIAHSWLWANSRPYVIRASGAVGNLTLDSCDLLPPQTTVAARKAAVYLDGAISIPKFSNCNFDGNFSIATGSGLIAENGVIGLQIIGGNAFGHDEDCIILDSIIAPVIDGVTFYNNNLSEDGSTDITIKESFAQIIEKPIVESCTHIQTAALAGTTGPAIKVDTGVTRKGIRVVNNTIQQPGAGGGYNDVEINLVDGAFSDAREGSLAGNIGTRTIYHDTGSHVFAAADTFETISYSASFAYEPRLDQIQTGIEGGGATIITRLQSSGATNTFQVGAGPAGHGGFTLHYNVSL